MSSPPDAADGTATGESATGTDPAPGEEQSSRYICVVCQKPLDGDARWRGEPVHLECGAELRCGITLGPVD